jgi:hypothetical protein
MYQEFSWGKRRPVRKDDLTAIYKPTAYKMWEPRRLTVTGIAISYRVLLVHFSRVRSLLDSPEGSFITPLAMKTPNSLEIAVDAMNHPTAERGLQEGGKISSRSVCTHTSCLADTTTHCLNVVNSLTFIDLYAQRLPCDFVTLLLIY